MNNFRKEAKELSTADLLLILDDQRDLYSPEEIEILEEELRSRPSDALQKENAERVEKWEEKEREKEMQQLRQAAREAQAELDRIRKTQIAALRAEGAEGYYEYMTLTLADGDGGALSPSEVTALLNSYAIKGWRLAAAYANELGHNSSSSGYGGYSSGTNSTVDQHILIMEKYHRI